VPGLGCGDMGTLFHACRPHEKFAGGDRQLAGRLPSVYEQHLLVARNQVGNHAAVRRLHEEAAAEAVKKETPVEKGHIQHGDELRP